MKKRIILADDHQIILDGLHSLIERQEDMCVVGVAENGRIAVKLARELRPDIVVIDIAMPDLNGVEATRQIKAENADARVIALSMHSERQFVVKMLEAGAAGFLLKDCAFRELIQAIRSVCAGETFLGRRVATIIVQDMADRLMTKKPPSMAPLTPRESEVLQLIAEGKSTKQIGYGLNVSAKTVETHRRNIMSKLDMNTVAELTKYAIREGITSLGA